MALDEKSIVGAHIVHISPPDTPQLNRPRLSLQHTSPSQISTIGVTPSASQCPTPVKEYDSTSTHPYSAFYSHPTTRTSFEQQKSESRVNIQIYEQDLEAGSRILPSLDVSRSTTNKEKECTVWPGRHQIIQKEMASKRRGGGPWSRLSKKQRILAHILIALIIVGGAVGIGVGISKAVGGGVWKSINSQSQIGDTDSG
ncbi:hypothetical protein MMC06_003110 [Schaereria dolodes]|nr:hypothetical protein [Schaereria dolodes]